MTLNKANSLILRLLKGNNSSKTDDILTNLHMHHHIIVIQYVLSISFIKFYLLLPKLQLRVEQFIAILATKGQ